MATRSFSHSLIPIILALFLTHSHTRSLIQSSHTHRLVSVAQFFIFYGFFSYNRKQQKQQDNFDLYEPRQNTRKHRSPEPFADHWFRSALAVSQEETLRQVGLDSYMFLRLLRLGARLTAVGTMLSWILIPVYATGEARGKATQQFNQLTLARVDANSDRLWATVAAWWIFVAFLLHELWTEWKLFAKNRSAFLATGDVDMPQQYRYSIRVEKIPPKLQNDAALTEYMERLFPGQVAQAVVYRGTGDMQKLMDERQKNILALESAVAFTKAKPTKERPMIKVEKKLGGCCGGRKVDAIEHYKSEIARLNTEIDEKRAAILVAVDNDDDDVALDKKAAAVACDTSQEIPLQTVTTNESSQEDDKAEPFKMSSTAFVTFSSLRAKQAAVQCELTGNPDSMNVFPAADPKGILWNNVTVPLAQQQILQIQAAAFWCVGILFWAVPVSFVTSIANLNSILQAFGLKAADPTAFWYGLVSGLLPVIALAILMAVLYMSITAAATSFVRFKSNSEVDAYAMYWHQLFQFANLWLILIGGSAFNQIDAIIDDPTSVVDIVVAALPGASVFFVNYITVASLGAFALELSMLPTYGVTLIMKLIQPEAMRTQRQLDDAKKPPMMTWGQCIPPVIFIFLVVNIYCTIVPILQIFGFVYFAGMYVTWKHQFLHVYAQDFEGGGQATWQAIFGFLMACKY